MSYNIEDLCRNNQISIHEENYELYVSASLKNAVTCNACIMLDLIYSFEKYLGNKLGYDYNESRAITIFDKEKGTRILSYTDGVPMYCF